MIESASRSSREGWHTAFAPATIANFGSGFDAFAAALVTVVPSESGDERASRSGGRSRSGSGGGSILEMRSIGDLVSVRRAKHRGVRVVAISGVGGRLPLSAARNTAAVAAAAVLRAARAPFGLDLALDKGLPLSSGLGSSAASAAAGAYAAALALASGRSGGFGAWASAISEGSIHPEEAVGFETVGVHRKTAGSRALGRSAKSATAVRSGGSGRFVESESREQDVRRIGSGSIDKSELIFPALKGEHVADGSWHGDNVWASLMGGAIIVISTLRAEIVPLESPPTLRWVTVHPKFELSTRRARAVLPKKVALSDAAAQAGRFASFVTAWRKGDRRGIGSGLEDRLAEPHRARLIHGYAAVRRAALRAGAYGLTLAGAGPSVLAVTPEGEEERVGEAMRAAFRRAGLDSTVLICAVDAEGARRVVS